MIHLHKPTYNKIILFLFILTASVVRGQNIQLHYDFGKNRNYFTSTVEMFKPDKWGNTFFFIDINYGYGSYKSPSESYFEIARCFKFREGPLSAQIEYNGGLGGNSGYSYAINNAWLLGIDYGIHNAGFSKTLNLKALYKYIVGKQHSAQLTAVWNLNFSDNRISLCGFADLWLEKDTYNTNGITNPVFITEPQFWYNFTEHFSAGSEIEMATNFGGVEGFKVCPTLALKWNF